LNELPFDDNVAVDEECKEGKYDILSIVMEKFNLC
jgi:hypothetical protein